MMELVCPAGTPAALRAAVEAGAHTVYCGFAADTNARNFPGLNFTPEELAEAVVYAHARGAKVLLALNTYPPAGKVEISSSVPGPPSTTRSTSRGLVIDILKNTALVGSPGRPVPRPIPK